MLPSLWHGYRDYIYIYIYIYIVNIEYTQFHNILRPFEVLPNFPVTTSETMDDYYLKTWYIRVALRVAERLRKYQEIV